MIGRRIEMRSRWRRMKARTLYPSRAGLCRCMGRRSGRRQCRRGRGVQQANQRRALLRRLTASHRHYAVCGRASEGGLGDINVMYESVKRVKRRHEQAWRLKKQWRSTMANVYIEARPKGRPEGDRIDDYVVEDHADHELGTFKTQHEAIAWAKRKGHA